MSSRPPAAARPQPRHEDESPSEAGDPVGLPSVRKLLARFEGGEGGDQAGRRLAKSHAAAQLQERDQVPQPRAAPCQSECQSSRGGRGERRRGGEGREGRT